MPSVGELWMSLEIKAGEFTEEPLTLHLHLHLRSESCKLRWAEMQVVPDRKLQRVESSVFVLQTLPETLQRPQAAPSRPAQLKPETGPRMESAKREAWSDAVVVAHSSHWLHESSTPASFCALVLSLLEAGARIKISPCSWLLGSEEEVEERKGCRGQTPTRNTTEEEEEEIEKRFSFFLRAWPPVQWFMHVYVSNYMKPGLNRWRFTVQRQSQTADESNKAISLEHSW